MRLAVFILLQVLAVGAHACRFARDAQPAEWYEWSSALFAGDVTRVETDVQRPIDVISVRILETFKGPQGSTASLKVPSRMWASCNLVRPAAGARVLVALNANGDTLLVPLEAAYSARLRALRPATAAPPAPPATAPQTGEKPFSY
jgi:hypothetical protein